MRIQDLEQRTGMERATIRFYERQGMINPRRTENGYRDYSGEDAEELLKIKLLRKLDFSLEQIQELRQGNASLSEAMASQLQYLNRKADATLRAGNLCRQIMEQSPRYDTLDAAFYLELLADPSRPVKFREEIVPESHPIRRFLARYIDWMLTQLLFLWLVFCVCRIRPVLPLYSMLALAAAVLGGIYLEALFVYLFGTTPGKWIMGIRVESAAGGKVTWEEALWRAKLVTQEGVGFRIPVWQEIRYYLGYKACSEGSQLPWEEDTELRFSPWNLKKKLCFGIVYILLAAAACGIGLDMIYYPAHRSDQLTLKQYIANYNGFAREGSTLSSAHQNETMTEKGQFDILPSIKADYIRQSPSYTYDAEGFLQEIEFTGKLEYDQKVVQHMILAAAAAQKNVKLMEIVSLKAGTMINQEIRNPIYYGATDGRFSVAGIEVSWNLDAVSDLITITIEWK